MKTFTRVIVLSSLLALGQGGSEAALLTYWNFNNVSPGYLSGNGTLGSFSTSAAAYGEIYVQSSNSVPGVLRSNTANGTVFNGTGISIDFTNLGTASTPNINGKTSVSGYTLQGQTNTTFGGYGTFLDSATNQVGGDSSTGGSLIIMNPSGASLNKYLTFSLSSAGYDTLSLSYATRISGGSTGTEIWSYSLDGTNFFNLTSDTSLSAGSFGLETLNLSALSSNALDDQASFYLRMTIGTGTSASYAFDNFQLNGVAVVPEPSTYALLGFGLLGLFLMRKFPRTLKS